MSNLLESFEAGCKEAEEDGCEVLVAGDYELFLDLDSDEAVKRFIERLPRVKKSLNMPDLLSYDRWTSRGGNTHVRVVLSACTSVEHRIILQQYLGSDEVREFITLERLRSGIDQPVRLFRPKSSDVVTVQMYDPNDVPAAGLDGPF